MEAGMAADNAANMAANIPAFEATKFSRFGAWILERNSPDLERGFWTVDLLFIAYYRIGFFCPA